jgi:hypothetical protein
MPKAIHSVLVLVLMLAVSASCAACGSAPEQLTLPSETSAAKPTATTPKPSPKPSTDEATALREKVRSRIDRMMADIDAAEKRGDMMDGVPVGDSSNPYDYVGISPAFVQLVALGLPALPAIATEIESSSHNGLREYLLAAAGAQIDGDVPSDGQSWDSGKDWARQYRAEQ